MNNFWTCLMMIHESQLFRKCLLSFNENCSFISTFLYPLALIHSLLKRSVLKTIGSDFSAMKKIDLQVGSKTWKTARKLTSDMELKEPFHRTFLLGIDWTSAGPIKSFCWKQSGSCLTAVLWISNLFEVPQLCHQQQFWKHRKRLEKGLKFSWNDY